MLPDCLPSAGDQMGDHSTEALGRVPLPMARWCAPEHVILRLGVDQCNMVNTAVPPFPLIFFPFFLFFSLLFADRYPKERRPAAMTGM